MTKLKLTDLAEDKPIRLTIELPAAVHRASARQSARHSNCRSRE